MIGDDLMRTARAVMFGERQPDELVSVDRVDSAFDLALSSGGACYKLEVDDKVVFSFVGDDGLIKAWSARMGEA